MKAGLAFVIFVDSHQPVLLLVVIFRECSSVFVKMVPTLPGCIQDVASQKMYAII